DQTSMPIEAAEETWSEKLSNMCSDIEDLNSRTQSTAEILETYYKVGSLLFKKEWVMKHGRSWLNDSQPSSAGTNVGGKFFWGDVGRSKKVERGGNSENGGEFAGAHSLS
ncbi:22680_t:CDS:2, partial [Cetraspora pellucida]